MKTLPILISAFVIHWHNEQVTSLHIKVHE